MPRIKLPCVTHPNFGVGFVLGQRFVDVGPVGDVFFVDGVVRTLQAGFLADAPRPDDVPKTLRAAYSAYKKAHPVKRSKPEDVPVEAPIDLDEDSWRVMRGFPGNEEELADENEVAA